MKVEDLTKPELIAYIAKYIGWHEVDEAELLKVRWDSLSNKSAKLMGESVKISLATSPVDDLEEWERGQALWERGKKASDEARVIFKLLNDLRNRRILEIQEGSKSKH